MPAATRTSSVPSPPSATGRSTGSPPASRTPAARASAASRASSAPRSLSGAHTTLMARWPPRSFGHRGQMAAPLAVGHDEAADDPPVVLGLPAAQPEAVAQVQAVPSLCRGQLATQRRVLLEQRLALGGHPRQLPLGCLGPADQRADLVVQRETGGLEVHDPDPPGTPVLDRAHLSPLDAAAQVALVDSRAQGGLPRGQRAPIVRDGPGHRAEGTSQAALM